jgi:hypothetical protein
MRTMKKSGALAALAVALLVVAVLVTQSCRIPVTGPGIGSGTEIGTGIGTETAKNTGSIRLNFGVKKGARTVMPDELFIGDFKSFTLTFSPSGGGSDIEVEVGPGGDYEDFTDPIVLPEDTYELLVVAYTTDDWTLPVAMAETGLTGGICTDALLSDSGTLVEEIDIVDGAPVDIYVTLKPYGLVGNGIFAWKITDELDCEYEATIRISNYPAGSAGVQTGTIDPANLAGSFGGPSQTVLASGYKWIDLTLTQPETGSKFVLRDIAHIYQNMTSTFEYTFLDGIIIAPTPPTTGEGGFEFEYVHPEGFTVTFSVGTPTPAGKIISGDGLDPTSAIQLSPSGAGTLPSGLTITMNTAGVTDYTWWSGPRSLGRANQPLIITIATGDYFGERNAKGFYGISLAAEYEDEPFNTAGKVIYIEIVD